MWDEIFRYLPKFPSAVLSGASPGNYPFSLRCHPEPEAPAGLLWPDDPAAEIADRLIVSPGPASLLFHKHDELLWNQESFLLRGRIELRERGWVFVPERFVPGMGLGGPVATARLLLRVRRSAAAYLRKRGLARPRIAWDEIESIKEQAQHR